MPLVPPTLDRLPNYTAALKRGWSPDNLRPAAAAEQLDRIADDPEGFIASNDDRDASAGDVILPDGSRAKRLPSFKKWIWQDGFCGIISLRWQPGTEALPPTCLGHIGYAVVPWRQGQGLATAALMALLPKARAVGLAYVELTTAPDNAPSIRVIEKAGGVLVERFAKPAALGGGCALNYRIAL